MKSIKKLSILVITGLILFVSCTSKKNNGTSDAKKEIVIGYVDGWAEGVAMTYITKEILTEQGYDVKMKNAAVDLIFASMSLGDIDVFMDVWMPVTHKEKIAKFKNKLEYISTTYDEAKLGLVVPAYVPVNSIEELNANRDKFEGKIIGIEKGAGLTAKTEKVIADYGLNFKQINSSSVAMFTEVKKAISKKEWIVFCGWAPHWMFGRFDLKFLEDPKKYYGEKEKVMTYGRKGFQKDNPELASFFKAFKLTNKQISDLMNDMEDGDNKTQVAKTWVKNHQELVKSWLKK
ncbi:glycine betaine ABC transporter substrate-binding protein [Halosquirtibacter xylanolyticus]|uniref:glycine betaine ABC transporter substrate-binding protein n=1 Tax=Halosquirtibacter xylanolyticus TaxID=3374599 RepID=UPI0037483447|nr:glycine betaine ABC transporter substrate-binding protein [Prolixibacteraceae bacterium]